MRHLAVAVTLASTLCFALPAAAQSRAAQSTAAQSTAAQPTPAQMQEARTLFERGLTFVDQERWGEALEYFRRSREIAERPSTVYNLAVALYRLGRAAEAARAFDDYLRVARPEDDRQQHAEATRLLAIMRAAIPTVTLTLEPANAEVRVDDVLVEGHGSPRRVELSAGERQLAVSATGRVTERFTVQALPEAHEERTITLVHQRTLVTITSDVPGVAIRLDGRLLAADERDIAVTPGEHRVEASAEGYRDFGTTFTATEGETVRVQAGLDRIVGEDVIESPWLWTAIVVLVVGAAVGVGVGIYVLDSAPEQLSDTGITIAALSF